MERDPRAAGVGRDPWRDADAGDHLVFPIVLSTDLAKSRAFYHDTLGLEVLREDDERIMFRCGGGSLLTVSLSTTGTARHADPARLAGP